MANAGNLCKWNKICEGRTLIQNNLNIWEKWSKINKVVLNQGKSKELWTGKKDVKDSSSCSVKKYLRVGEEYKLDLFWGCISKSALCKAHRNKCLSLHCAGETVTGLLVQIHKVEGEYIGDIQRWETRMIKTSDCVRKALKELSFY